MQRGEIWWADLEDPTGSAPGYRRPVLIIQSDSFNQSKIQTVIVVALTSNMVLADMPGNVAFYKAESKLPKDSVVNISQIMTLDKSTLKKKVSAAPDNLVHVIDAGLKLVLGLGV
jgi:mRNA interferase MazF